MLDGLDEIDWGSLNHAYGPAEDVPGLIRNLTSQSKQRRERALWELYGNIWHQHTVYEATAPAVPFLVEVALAETVPDSTRDGVIILLAEIAEGESYLDVHRDFLEEGGVEIDQDELTQQLGWAAAAHERVRSLAEPFWAFLAPSAPAPRRLAAAYLASKFPEDRDSLIPPLRALRDRESDGAARAAYALALALLGEHDRGLGEELASLLDTDVDHEALPDVLRELEAGGDTALASSILADLVTSTMSRLAA